MSLTTQARTAQRESAGGVPSTNSEFDCVAAEFRQSTVDRRLSTVSTLSATEVA